MRMRLLQIQNRLVHYAYAPHTYIEAGVYVDDVQYLLGLLKKADPADAVFTAKRNPDSEPPRP